MRRDLFKMRNDVKIVDLPDRAAVCDKITSRIIFRIPEFRLAHRYSESGYAVRRFHLLIFGNDTYEVAQRYFRDANLSELINQ